MSLRKAAELARKIKWATLLLKAALSYSKVATSFGNLRAQNAEKFANVSAIGQIACIACTANIA